MKRSILAISTLAFFAALTVPVLADEPYGTNDQKYNLNTSAGVKKLFRDNDSGRN